MKNLSKTNSLKNNLLSGIIIFLVGLPLGIYAISLSFFKPFHCIIPFIYITIPILLLLFFFRVLPERSKLLVSILIFWNPLFIGIIYIFSNQFYHRSWNVVNNSKNFIIVDGPFSNPTPYHIKPTVDCKTNLILEIVELKEASSNSFRMSLKKDGDYAVDIIPVNTNELKVDLTIPGNVFFHAKPGKYAFHANNNSRFIQSDDIRLILQDGSSFNGKYHISLYCE